MGMIPEVKCRRCGETFSSMRSRCPNCGTRRVTLQNARHNSWDSQRHCLLRAGGDKHKMANDFRFDIGCSSYPCGHSHGVDEP